MFFIRGNVFDLDNLSKQLHTTPESLRIAHCIASDFGMYGGIARQFVEVYDMKNKLFEYVTSKNITSEWKSSRQSYFKTGTTKAAGTTKCYLSLIGKAVKIENVYNLVTKDLTCSLPTLQTLEESLLDLKFQMRENCETHLILPDMIGCGIDQLQRDDVISLVDSIFKDTNVKVVAVKL